MSEKVKLPKEVCDALDMLDRKIMDISKIFMMSFYHEWTDERLYCLTKVDADLLMRALVLGYEPELSVLEDDAE